MRARRAPDQENLFINPEQDWQCRWWSKELGVRPEDLRAAIRIVGPLARNVRAHLNKASGAPFANS